MKIRKYLIILLVCFFLVTLSASLSVMAITRTATISASNKEVTVGQTVTVTLGFKEIMETRPFTFRLAYDSSLLEYVSGKNISGLPGGVNKGGGDNLLVVGVNPEGTQSVVIGSALSLTFKTKSTGMATLKIVEANDGIIDPKENYVNPGAAVTITIKDPPTTTTTTTTTTAPTTTTTTTTTTTPKTTTTKTTTPKTTTSKTTTSSTPTSETTPEVTRPVIAFSAKRYDGVSLVVPESVPSEENIPASFNAVDINDYEEAMTVYRSSTLPYTLFWLADEGDNARFYYCDEETSLYVPFFRTEWSSRYFTFSIVPEDRLPEGFELATLDIRDQKVPVYVPVKGFYMTHQSYFDLMSKVDPDTSLPDWHHYEGETTQPTSTEPSESSDETTGDSTDPSSSTPSDGNGQLTWQGVPVEIPDDILLVALRMNDSEKKMLYFYDRTLDSLIRADLWLVPLARTFLDRDETAVEVQPTTVPTEPSTTPSEGELMTDEPNTVTLFGLTMPKWVPIAAVAILIVLLILLIRGIVRAKKEKGPEFDFHLDRETYDDDQGDALSFDEVPESDDAASIQDSWERLGIVDVSDRSPDTEEWDSVQEESFNLIPDHEEPSDTVSDSEELLDDSAAAYDEKSSDVEETVTAVPPVQPPVRRLEGEWGDLQRAVERSSARRQGREPVLDDVIEEETVSQDAVHDEMETEPVEETSKRIIQPGRGGSRPIRRVPLKRLRSAEESTQEHDQPLDEDEL